MNTEKFKSDISGLAFPVSEKIKGNDIRNTLFEFIRTEYPSFSEEMCLSESELNAFRHKYISTMLSKEIGQLGELENKVLNSINDQTILSDQLDDDKMQSLTYGQRVADNVASFGGSWTFIISFAVFITIWISGNVYWLANHTFDPYPFILLNLILSCIAALQAPVIMMSQNRQEEKDRERAKKDYMINLKSELEIRILHEKIDHLMIHQQQELMEIQRVQIEMMEDIIKNTKR